MKLLDPNQPASDSPGAGPRGGWKLFVAAIPDAQTVSVLERLQQGLRTELDRFHAREAAAWLPASQFHLTLEFLGNLAPEKVPQITECMETAVQTSGIFDVTVQGVGAFPVFRQPRVLWAGIQATPALLALRKNLRTSLGKVLTLDPVDSYYPHVTLARVKARSRLDSNLLRSILERMKAEQDSVSGEWRVHALSLLRSSQSGSGLKYQCLATARMVPN